MSKFMIGFSISVSIIVSCYVATATAAEVYDPTNDLYDAFGAKCNGYGSINSESHREAVSLMSIIQSIRQDTNCDGISSALSEIEALKIAELQKTATAKTDLDVIWNQIYELQLAMDKEISSANPDAAYIDSLKVELSTLKTTAAKSLSNARVSQLTIRRNSIDTFKKASSSLFSKLKNNDLCLVKRPNLATQIGAQVIGLGTTLSSGLAGALLLSIGSIVDDFVSFFRNKDLSDRNLRQFRLGEAVGCAIESMSATYCKARDTELVVEYNSKAINQYANSAPNWLRAAGTLAQGLDAYQNWITRVHAGSPAATNGQAQDKNNAVNIQSSLRKLKIETDATLNMAQARVPLSPDPQQAKRTALITISGQLSGNSTITNLFQEPGCGPFIYIMSGGRERTRQIQPNESCEAYLNRKFPNEGLPDLAGDVPKSLGQILNEGTSASNVELSQVIESNAEAVIAAAETTFNGKSARHFLVESYNYLVSLLEDPSSIAQNQNQRVLILKTKEQIKLALQILDSKEDDDGNGDNKAVLSLNTKSLKDSADKISKIDSVKKVADLSLVLIPAQDRLALPSALSMIINQDIDSRMSQGTIDEKLTILLRLSPRDSLSALIPTMLSVDTATMQIDSAQLLARNNLVTVSNVFTDALKNRLDALSSSEYADDKSAQRAKANLCVQLLSIPQQLKFNIADYCKGAFIRSRRENSNITIQFDELWGKPFSQRVCAVYDFHRKSFLFGVTQKNGYK